MYQSKFVVVEVTSTPSTMTLIQYLITNGYDKFAVVADLSDHPSLKYKGTNGSAKTTTTNAATNQKDQNGTTNHQSPATTNHQTTTPAAKPRASINEIANALSKRSSPSVSDTSTTVSTTPTNAAVNINNNSSNSQAQMNKQAVNACNTVAHSTLSRLLEDQTRQQQEQKREQERQQVEIQRLILAQAQIQHAQHLINNPFMIDTDKSRSPEMEAFNSSTALTPPKTEVDDRNDSRNSDGIDYGLGPSDEQVRASMIHLLNPALGSAFGFDETATPKRKGQNEDGTPTSKKHRWLTTAELEESRFGKGKVYGRVHCKATYKCALCGKPTTLNSTGSRWNLLRHVIMIHSDSKPYQCMDCDFVGIKSNVTSHARQARHRSDDANDITTDAMRAEWNAMLHQCFPEYVKAKHRGWQQAAEEEIPVVEEEMDVEQIIIKSELT